jgi:streptogramin lyase
MLPLMVLTLVAASHQSGPTIRAFAGTGEKGFTGDGGRATAAKLDNPFDVAFDRAGNLYFSDTNNHVVRRVDAKTGLVTTVAGNGKYGNLGDDGAATAASLNEPYGIELDDENNLYIVDRLNYAIRRVDAKSGIITRIAGTGKSASSPDGGTARDAALVEPNGLCLDGKGRMYIADVRDQRVRFVDLKTGTIGTLAGTAGKKASAGDGGSLEQATFAGPRAVAMHPDGSVVVVEREGNSVRKIDLKSKTIVRVAGTGKKGYTGDGGPAKAATFDGPKELDIDADGTIYVVDTENEAIRKIDAKSGIVTTIAGKGRTKSPGQGDGGSPLAATLGRPHGVAIRNGAIYIGDTLSHRIRMVK